MAQKQKDPKPKFRTRNHQDFIGGLLMLDNFLYSSSEDGSLVGIDLREGKKYTLLKDMPALNYIAAHEDHLLFLCCDDGKVHVYDVRQREVVHLLEGLDDSGVRKVAISSEGMVVAGTNSGQVGIWEHYQSSVPVMLFDVHNGATVNAVCTHPSAPLAATSGMDGLVLIWDLVEAEVMRELEPVEGTFVSGMFHYGASSMLWEEGFLFVGKNDVHVYNFLFERVNTLGGFAYAIQDMVLYRNTLFALSNGIKSWDLPMGKEGISFELAESGYSLAVSRDGKELFVGMDYGLVSCFATIHLVGHKPTAQHSGKLRNFLVTEENIFTAGEDRKIMVWDAFGQFLYRINAKANYVTIIAFHGRDLIFLDDKVLYWYNVDTRKRVHKQDFDVFNLEEVLQVENEVFLTAVGHFPQVLNLETRAVEGLPFRFVLYQMLKVGQSLFFTGYNSFAQTPEDYPEIWAGEEIEDGHRPFETPVVQFDLDSRTYVHEYWLRIATPYGSWRSKEEKIYPTSLVFQDGYLFSGYVGGRMAKWRIGAEKPEILKQVGDHYTHPMYLNAAGNLIVSNGKVVLLDHDLNELARFSQKNSVTVCHYDPEHGLVLAYQHFNYILYFLDAETLEVQREEKINRFVDDVIQIGDRFMVFCDGKLQVFDW